MDFSQVLLAVPNLVIAVWVIYTLQKQNALLQEKLAILIDKLMDLHPPQSEQSADRIAENNANNANKTSRL